MSSSIAALKKRMAICAIASILSVSASSLASASYIDDIGYPALQAELGAATPTGAGVRVTQVEAPVNDVSGGAPPIFMPDPSGGEFVGKTIVSPNGNPSGSFSSHASSIGQFFYGNVTSMARGVTQINTFEASNWINSLGALNGMATTSTSRIANHSWVGGGTDLQTDATILRLVDRQVALNEYIQVVALSSNPGPAPLLGGAYNPIVVGRTDGVNHVGTDAVDAIYVAGRTAPTVVSPLDTPSAATPVVASAAALLVQTGHDAGLRLSTGSTTKAGIGTIYDAERSETVKATLMAGADRHTSNSSTPANITDYRSAGHQTANGLDDRYGAGQVNILNSYHILAGGEQHSLQNGGHDVSLFGFDYTGAFGGVGGSPRTASYFFTATDSRTLYASLVWNVSISNNASLTATLNHLNLSLFDVTKNSLVTTSASSVDNTQNLFIQLLLGDRYELRVTTNGTAYVSQDYALAWRMEPSPVPVPAAAWLFGIGIVGLAGIAHRRMTE